MSTDNGGPAFPGVEKLLTSMGEIDLPRQGGITLRDYFAAKAMQASISGHFSHHGHESYWPPTEIASYAYECADAMLKARGGAQ